MRSSVIVLCGLLVHSAGNVASAATIIFSENFSGGTPGIYGGGTVPGTQMKVTLNSVAILGVLHGSFFGCANNLAGNCLGLSGGSGMGNVSSVSTFNLTAGTVYTIQFGVTAQGVTNNIDFQVSLGNFSQKVTATPTPQPISLTYVPLTNESNVSLSFVSITNLDNIHGAVLDNIVVSAETNTAVVQKVLSQVAFGGGWYTALYFTNAGGNPVSFPVNFISDAGTPLTLFSIGGSSTTVSLSGRGTAVIEALNSGDLSQGYALVQLPGGVSGYGVFRQSVAGRPDQEAVVPLVGAFTTTSTMIYDDTSSTTTFALANLSSSPISVTITARNNSGQTIGSTVVPVIPNGKYANTLKSLPGLGGVTGSRGSVDFQTNTGNIAVLGLRFGGVAFTSVPTSDR
jgi:hypothetical protein